MEPQYPLIFFTLFLCLACGMLAIQGSLLVTGKGTRKFHLTTVVVEAVLLALGGFSSFLHLHHWERIFNGFGHLSSGITQELIGIVVTAVALVIMFVVLRRSEAEGASEARLARVRVGVLALVVGVAMGFVCAHSYDMSSRPAWSNATLYLYYYASEFVLGVAGIWTVAAALKQDEATGALLARLTLVAGIVSAVVVIACGFYYTTITFANVGIAFHTTAPTASAVNPEGALASPMSGDAMGLFWGGAVLLGSLVAAACGFAGMKKPALSLRASACVLVCALAGGVCFRLVLYVVGVAYYVYF